MKVNHIYNGDCLEILKTIPNAVINCCVTSPPYWGLRDYGHDGQIGLEKTPEEYVAKMVELFREVKRVLKDDGTIWLNLGDSYWGGGFGQSPGGNEDFADRYPKQASNRGTADHEVRKRLSSLKKSHESIKPKDLIGIPWRVAFGLQEDGWYLRQDIIWHKPNPMPESVTDRCTKSHEYIFLLSKSSKYYFDNEAIKEETLTQDSSDRDRDISKLNNTPGRTRMAGLTTNNYEKRNKRSVWTVTTKPFSGAHFATFPEDLILPCILAGCPSGGVVLDPFMGAGTTALVVKKNGCNYIGCELNPEYVEIAEKRLAQDYLF